jgi:hypothetical protein
MKNKYAEEKELLGGEKKCSEAQNLKELGF